MDYGFLKNENVIYDALPKIHCLLGSFGAYWGMFAFVDFFREAQAVKVDLNASHCLGLQGKDGKWRWFEIDRTLLLSLIERNQ